MGITDELRAYAGNFYLFRYKDVREKLDAIADRIDAEYQKAIRELNNLADTSVLLPVDADGVPIHIGDVMDKGRVTCIRDCGKGWEVILDSLYTFDTPTLHHRAPTVEDVLREFTDEVWNRCCEGATASDSGIDELVAEYAAKLRLANDGEEQ